MIRFDFMYNIANIKSILSLTAEHKTKNCLNLYHCHQRQIQLFETSYKSKEIGRVFKFFVIICKRK